MTLAMKTECRLCQAPTPSDAVAYICSYECTYCIQCASHSERCPNCKGELQPRPRRNLTTDSPSMTLERLVAFDNAWQQADLESLMSFVAEDCIYAASVGSEPGSTFRGRAQVKEGFRELLAYEAQTEGSNIPLGTSGPRYLHGHRAFCHWSYWQKQANGKPAEVRGCDFFEFEGRLIKRKDAFIKSPIASLCGDSPK